MSNLKQTAQAALEALESWRRAFPAAWGLRDQQAVAALKAALAESQPEPVAEVYYTFGHSQDPPKCSGYVWLAPGYFPPRGTKLYAAPQAQPLSDEQIAALTIMLDNHLGDPRVACLSKLVYGGKP